jgi:subtilisin family serine protease
MHISPTLTLPVVVRHAMIYRSTTPSRNVLGCLTDVQLFQCLREARSETNALLDAVESIAALGVVVVVSAGNTLIPGASACRSTPGKSGKVITVGGSTAQNRQWLFGKSGKCVDVFAPAQAIRSAWFASDQSSSTQSGTSASAPIVAGVAALYLQRDPTMTPAQVKQAIIDDSVRGLKWKGLFSPNRLVSTVALLQS